MRDRKRMRRGVSMVEFTLIVPVWLPLLLGTMLVGSSMIREQEVMQMARDLGSMYSRGVDFSTTGAHSGNIILQNVTQAAGSVAAGGNGTAIFSIIEWLGPNECGGAGGPNCPGTLNTWVFYQQYKQPSTSTQASAFGTPAGAQTAGGDPSFTDYLTNPADRSTFSLLPDPTEASPSTDGYQGGQPVYIVELYFKPKGFGVFGGGGTYAYAIF
jgi:hypothetical protein